MALPTVDPALSHRRSEVMLTVRDAAGDPVPDTDLVIEQTRHAFGFGNIGFDFVPLAAGRGPGGQGDAPATDLETFGGASPDRLEHLADLWLDLFNTATLPFYWGRFEPVRGRPDTVRLQDTARWFAERGVAVKGHPLVWHTVTAPWLLELPLDEVEAVLRQRVRREVTEFAGLIDAWDAINEAVIMPVFAAEDNGITRLALDRGRIHMVRLAFEEARAANPSATLLLNDFDLSSAYECLIEGVLEAGIRIDAIGLQTHMHQGYKGEEHVLAAVERFARYGLPIHMTETTFVSGDLMPPEIVDLNDFQVAEWPSTPEGEARQADDMVRHYRSLMSHPSVEAITYWGLTDDGAWLGAPAGMVRADGSPKPSYDALHRLVKGEWWMPATPTRTDAAGRVRVSGFHGDYRVTAGPASGAFALEAGATDAAVGLAPDRRP